MSKKKTLQRLVELFSIQKFDRLLTEANEALSSYPEDAQVLCYLALAQKNLGRVDEAIETTGRAIAADPDDAYPWYLRSLYLTSRYKTDEALVAAKTCVEMAPYYEHGLIQLSIAAYYAGDRELSREAAEAAIKENPNSSAAWDNKGKLESWAWRWGAAEECYRKALEISSNHAPTLTRLAEALSKLGKHDEAVEIYRRAVVANPRWSTGLAGLSQALQAIGNFPEALDYAYRAVQMYPERHYITSSWIGLLSRFEPERALEEAQKHVLAFPKEAGPWTRLAHCFTKLDRFVEAVEAARTAVKVAPSTDYTYDVLVRALFRIGEKEEGLAIAKERARLSKGDPYPWQDLAVTAFRLDRELSLEATEKMLELTPNDPHILHTTSCIYLVHGDVERALKLTAKLLEVAPEAYGSWEQDAWIRFYANDGFEEALAAARARCCSKLEFLKWDAMEYIRAEDWESAYQSTNEALEAGASGCEAAAYHGVALARTGRIEEAKKVVTGGAVGISNARLCPSRTCPNGGYLEEQIEQAIAQQAIAE